MRDLVAALLRVSRRVARFILAEIRPRYHIYADVKASGPHVVGLTSIRFEVHAPRDGIQSADLVLTAQAGQTAVGNVALNRGLGTLHVGLHSHLLKNGQNLICYELLAGKRRLQSGSFSVDVRNDGDIAAAVTQSLKQSGGALFLLDKCDSKIYDYSNNDLAPWFDRPDALQHIERRVRSGELDARTAHAFSEFVEKGYMVFEDLLDEVTLKNLNKDMDRAIESKFHGYTYGSSARIEHMHVRYDSFRDLIRDRRYLDILDKLFLSSAVPCQSLVFVFGSQQDAHQDTVHLTPFPAGYMCGVWIALEDVREGAGELEVYPGAHRLPRLYMHSAGCDKVRDSDWKEFVQKVVPLWRSLISESRIDKIVYRPKRGTVLIWHENLMHAGGVRSNPDLSRRSVVFHCFAQGSIAYYDSSGDIATLVAA